MELKQILHFDFDYVVQYLRCLAAILDKKYVFIQVKLHMHSRRGSNYQIVNDPIVIQP